MKVIFCFNIGLCLICVLLWAAEGEDGLTPQVEFQKRIEQLINQLGDKDYSNREKAQRSLEEIGELAKPLLEKADGDMSLPIEIRQQVFFILKVIAIKKRVKLSQPFLIKFPDIYRNFAIDSVNYKHMFLNEITRVNEHSSTDLRDTLRSVLTNANIPGKYIYFNEVTNEDLTALLIEVLSTEEPKLTVQQKKDIIAMAIGDRMAHS